MPKDVANLLVQDAECPLGRELAGAARVDVARPGGVGGRELVGLKRVEVAREQVVANGGSGTRRGGRIARPMTSMRPMFSRLMWWYSACG